MFKKLYIAIFAAVFLIAYFVWVNDASPYSPYPTVKQANKAMAAYSRGPCGDAKTLTCDGVRAANMGCNFTYGDQYRVCQGYYTESSIFPGRGYRVCFLKYPTRVKKLGIGIFRVSYYDDSCYKGHKSYE